MTSKVGPKGQVVIPKAIRDRLGIEPGDEVTFTLDADGVRLQPIRDDAPLGGRFRGKGLTRMLEREHRREIEHGR